MNDKSIDDALEAIKRREFTEQPPLGDSRRQRQHELLGFLAICAVKYQEDYGLDGLHPTHYDLMVKYGARMVDFKRATNAPRPTDTGSVT